jgi:hypothetical protein
MTTSAAQQGAEKLLLQESLYVIPYKRYIVQSKLQQRQVAKMPITTDLNVSDATSTTILHRPLGGVVGYRKLTDRASRVCVHAFPIVMVQQLSAAGLLVTPGAYVLTGAVKGAVIAYFGESKDPGRRGMEHAADPLKRFVSEVFVIAGCDGCPLDKRQIVDLQYRFTNLAVDAGLVTVLKGANPQALDLSEAERSTQDRIFEDAKRLLYDTGCRILHSNSDSANVPEPPLTDDAIDIADTGPMEIGVTTTPLGAEEFELVYGDVWARGYWSGGHFIVAAGSEVRTQTNGSVNAITRSRRDELFNAEVLSGIPGVDDRRRLVAAVAFPSMSIAAKVVCGAHTTNRWTPLARSRAVVLAA